MGEELWSELEKLDILRERMSISYEEARMALNMAHGDVVKALADLEKVQGGGEKSDREFTESGNGVLESIKSSLTTFSKSTIHLKRNDKTIASVSAPLGLALAYTVWRKPGLRMLALVGALGAAMNHFELGLDTQGENSYSSEAPQFVGDEE